jgi:DNA-binding transcriptional LysR family regulator
MHIVPGLPDCCGRYPDLVLDLRISDSVVDLVEGAFDVAVRYAELGDSSFVAWRLAPDRRVLVASPEYLRRRARPKTPDDLATVEAVLRAGVRVLIGTHRQSAGESRTARHARRSLPGGKNGSPREHLRTPEGTVWR